MKKHMTSSNAALVKTATVLKPFTIDFSGHTLTVPVGAKVTNKTASGPDDSYRFWIGWEKSVKEQIGEELIPLTLKYDLDYRGILVPEENCSNWGE